MGKRKGSRTTILLTSFLGVALLLGVAGCQTIREFAALRSVDFGLDRVTQARLAGVELDRLRSFEDVSATTLLRLGAAVAEGDLPLEFYVHVQALNPDENQVTARMVEMDWTLFVEDRETISGVFNREVALPPGQVQDIPVFIELDLVDFFDENLQDLVELALNISGQGGAPKNIALEAVPTIRTPIGPITYPRPITIVHRELGRGAGGP